MIINLSSYLTKDGAKHSVGNDYSVSAVAASVYNELVEKARYAYSSPHDEHSNASKKIPGKIQ